ncbi:hypothetical protein L486_00114 [Kwoniella mangroviensis CBS 10435]|uniref:SURP motif domain-containing protein n=1 Tax=Kwoniella mangroviensis CBS 10435 TaxID=1331196 RepID=A0A1B9IY82_9TREE|nr:hypothetical protein L486_00114 [Kwoniella mangroviensis CBS 10435]
MYPRPHKRSHASRSHHSHSARTNPSASTSTSSASTSTTVQIPPIAYVQAYEAQLVYSQDDRAREVTRRDTRTGMGLIRYAGDVEDVAEEGVTEIWADRHDILHLLPSVVIPSTTLPTPSSPLSSFSSWNSLPSDIEETFYLSDPEEIEAYEQQKKRKWIEALRQERLKEREKEDEENEVNDGQMRWNESEEPPAPVLALMQHTAKAIFSSPNPSVLELRILTNHANDERFEFLKGRYKPTWTKIKDDLKKGKQKEQREKEKKKGIGLGGLGGYDSSDNSDDDNEQKEEVDDVQSPPPPPSSEDEDVAGPPPPPPEDGIPLPPTGVEHIPQPMDGDGINGLDAGLNDGEEEKRRLRRMRMEEWKKKRAAEKGS